MKAVLMTIAGASASILAALMRLIRPITSPMMRLVHLAQARARIRGNVPVTTQFDGPIRTSGRPRVDLREHCRLGRDAFFETQGAGAITIGRHVRINAGCIIVSYAGITIGDDCLIGEYVSIRDANHGVEVGEPMRTQAHTADAITIGSDVWIGRGAVILTGVTIGAGAIIGANSVVTHDVPEHAIAVGSPARVARYRNTGDEIATERDVLASVEGGRSVRAE